MLMHDVIRTSSFVWVHKLPKWFAFDQKTGVGGGFGEKSVNWTGRHFGHFAFDVLAVLSVRAKAMSWYSVNKKKPGAGKRRQERKLVCVFRMC